MLYRELLSILGFPRGPESNMFPNTAFSGTTLNMGPYASCKPHRDSQNLVGGVCMIVVLGDFDHTKSGHFIMHEPKVILEARPGDIIFMPSAAITHSNAGLRPGERRSSIVQYISARLFSWAWQGFKCLPKNESAESKQARASEGLERWKELCQLFPTVSELQEAKTSGALAVDAYQKYIRGGRSLLLPIISHD